MPRRKSNIGISAPSLALPPVALTEATPTYGDAAAASLMRLTLTADRELRAINNPVDGQTVTVEVTASGGARTLTLATAFNYSFTLGSDITAITATASGKTDVLGFRYNAAAFRWWVVAYVKGF